jgi:hypothetical protein
MRLPGAVGIDSRDRRGVRRGASEILTSLMLVYVDEVDVADIDAEFERGSGAPARRAAAPGWRAERRLKHGK